MKFLRDIQKFYNSKEVVTWQDVFRFLKSDQPWPIAVVIILLVGMCTCEVTLFVLFVLGVY